VVGQWLSLSVLFVFNTMFSMSSGSGFHEWPFYVFFVLGFGLFRLFDILKPWPVSWADKKSTPLGVMLDDVLAGIMAAIVLTLLVLIRMIVF
jgi:phosphatidylglycerophosphatase A